MRSNRNYGTTCAGDGMGEWGQVDVAQQPPTAGVEPLHPVLTNLRSAVSSEPTVATRNRKQLGENELSNWELRLEKYRVFYHVVIEADGGSVEIKAIEHKEHNTLYIGGKEVQL